MTVTSIQTEAAGFGSFQPRHGRMVCTNALSAILVPGYLNNSPSAKGQPFSNGDMIDILYSNGSGTNTSGIFQISIPPNSQIITLLEVTPRITGVTTVSTTPATGSCAAQFQITSSGNAIAGICPVNMYLSTSAGALAASAASSIVALTNGVLHQVTTGLIVFGTTSTTGQVGITLTATTGTYYVTFVLPTGQLIVSSALVCN
jgi:hypothetical protein